ncbi:MAG: endonuclease/exonuclease/phosphatase family protein [Acidobacteria bacterium]|nr:endonuclease/exonuclease/phosphatase family protein [Acidobacteriota bacterium]
MKIRFAYIAALLITLFAPSAILAQGGNFRVLSYNVLEGFRKDPARMDRFVAWVKEKDPDLIFYQEMNGFTQVKLEQLARRFDHPYAVLSKTAGYPVALSSKYPIVDVQKVVDNMWHAYITADVHGYKVVAIHLSPHQVVKRRQEMDELLYRISLFPRGSRVIFAGDFNSFNAHDGAGITDDQLGKLKEIEERRPEVRNLWEGKPDFSVTAKAEKAGMVDAYRLERGKGRPDYAKNHPQNARRIDYIWVSANLRQRVKDCDFVYDDVTKELSDHHPLLMDLRP